LDGCIDICVFFLFQFFFISKNICVILERGVRVHFYTILVAEQIEEAVAHAAAAVSVSLSLLG
jgi:hypothetical protein